MHRSKNFLLDFVATCLFKINLAIFCIYGAGEDIHKMFIAKHLVFRCYSSFLLLLSVNNPLYRDFFNKMCFPNHLTKRILTLL